MKTVFLNVRLEPAMHEQLAVLAKEHERTLAGELRVALRRYLDEHKTTTNEGRK